MEWHKQDTGYLGATVVAAALAALMLATNFGLVPRPPHIDLPLAIGDLPSPLVAPALKKLVSSHVHIEFVTVPARPTSAATPLIEPAIVTTPLPTDAKSSPSLGSAAKPSPTVAHAQPTPAKAKAEKPSAKPKKKPKPAPGGASGPK